MLYTITFDGTDGSMVYRSHMPLLDCREEGPRTPALPPRAEIDTRRQTVVLARRTGRSRRGTDRGVQVAKQVTFFIYERVE
jgi:hypothetical protein